MQASYVEALTNFKLHEAFPDLDPGFHHFRVDPYDPSRVWFTSTCGALHPPEIVEK